MEQREFDQFRDAMKETTELKKSRSILRDEIKKRILYLFDKKPTKPREWTEKKGPSEAFFAQSTDFAETIYNHINARIVPATMKKPQRIEQPDDEIIEYLEDLSFSGEVRKDRFVEFFRKFDTLLKRLEQRVKTFRAQGLSEAGLIGFLQDFLNTIKAAQLQINQHQYKGAQEYFPWFDQLDQALGSIQSIADFQEWIEATYPRGGVTTASHSEYSFLQDDESYEQYRDVFFLYKTLQYALLHYQYDKTKEPQFDEYLSEEYHLANKKLRSMGFQDKQLIVAEKVKESLQQFCNFFKQQHGESITITNKELLEYGIDTITYQLTPSCRFKSPGSKIRKSLMKSEYPNQNHDYFGSKIEVNLPELELLKKQIPKDNSLAQSTKDKLLNALEKTDRAIRKDLGKQMTAYIPAITGSFNLKVDRVRGFLDKDILGQYSVDEYMAIQCSMGDFTIDNMPFFIANEIILALKYVGHQERAYYQYKDLADGYYYNKSREDMLRHATKHIIVPEEYRAHTSNDYDILSPVKSKRHPSYLINKGNDFRKEDAKKLLPGLIRSDRYLFAKLFEYNPPEFNYKITTISKEALEEKFPHLTPEQIDQQIHAYARNILQREYTYLIYPLQTQLKHLRGIAEKNGDEKTTADYDEKLSILAQYLLEIDQAYGIIDQLS